MRLALTASLLVGAICAPFATVEAQDFGYVQTTTFTLSDQPSGYALDEETEVEITYRSERSTYDRSVQVVDASYAPLSDLRGTWNGRRIDAEHIEVRTPQMADVFMAPGEVRTLSVPETPTVGDVLAYRFRRSFDDVAYLPILTVPEVDRVERFEVVVEHPESVTVEFDVFAPRDDAPHVVEREPGRTTIRLAPTERAPTLPLFAHAGVAAQVLVRAHEAGRAVLPTAPADFARWYGELTRDARPDALSDRLVSLAESLERDSEEGTVAAIHDYVRGTVRYVADERAAGAIVPRVPDLVVERGYGDCKDRAFLVSALARHHGIEVDPVLVSTTPVADFDAGHVSLYNHVISAWDRPDGGTVYFDPTHRHVPFGALPESDVSAQALRISASEARQVRLPALSSAPTFEVTVRGDLDDLGDAAAEVTVRGELFAAVSEALATGRGVDLENVLSAVSANSLYKIRLSQFVPIDVGADSARFEAVADLSEYVVASPTRRYIPQTPFRAVPAELGERSGDDLPIWIDLRTDARLVLDLNPGALVAAPDSVSLGSPSTAAFTAALTTEADRVRIEYRYRQAARRFDGADRDAYLDFGLAYLGARRDMFILRPAESGTP